MPLVVIYRRFCNLSPSNFFAQLDVQWKFLVYRFCYTISLKASVHPYGNLLEEYILWEMKCLLVCFVLLFISFHSFLAALDCCDLCMLDPYISLFIKWNIGYMINQDVRTKPGRLSNIVCESVSFSLMLFISLPHWKFCMIECWILKRVLELRTVTLNYLRRHTLV